MSGSHECRSAAKFRNTGASAGAPNSPFSHAWMVALKWSRHGPAGVEAQRACSDAFGIRDLQSEYVPFQFWVRLPEFQTHILTQSRSHHIPQIHVARKSSATANRHGYLLIYTVHSGRAPTCIPSSLCAHTGSGEDGRLVPGWL
jgi:hypothetical protein